MNDIEKKIKQEREIFDKNINVHDLPAIYHYWSNKYLRPILEEHDMSHPDDLYVNNMFKSAIDCGQEKSFFISIGSGNCETEIRLAKRLKQQGLSSFCIECLDLSPVMLQRGHDLAVADGVGEHLEFIEADCNHWKPNKSYVSVIANQSLHHIQSLETLFSEIRCALHENGTFITSDMIGRNGHQRWPEALFAVHKFWRELPEAYKYNHLLARNEALYENWDCSTEGFEGIRAQDILPLLIKEFHFELFIGFSNIIDIFIDRCFGHNFDQSNAWDTDFIDRVQLFDEEAICAGTIKPVHIMAAMKNSPVNKPIYSRGLSPEFCLRDPNL